MYGALFAVLAASGMLFLSQYATDVRFWERFTFGYLLLLVGYTWWPMFALVTWPYRVGSKPVTEYLIQMGLWDLQAQADGTLARVRTRMVDRYRSCTASGIAQVGRIATPGLVGARAG